jgi:hypothetical protein
MDELYRSCEFPSARESEPKTMSFVKPYCSSPTQHVLHIQKELQELWLYYLHYYVLEI